MAERATIDSIVGTAHGIDSTLKMVYSYKESGNIMGQIIALRQLGKLYRDNSQFMEAIEIHQQGLQLATSIEDTVEMVKALNNIGTNYRRLGSYEEAANFHQQAAVLCTKMSDQSSEFAIKNRVISLNGMGNVLMSLGNIEQADSIFRLALQGESKLGSELGQAINLANLGSIKSQQGQNDSARYYFQRSLEMNEQAGSQLGIGLCHIRFGELDEKNGVLDKAIEEYQTAYGLLKTVHDDWHWLEAVLNIAHIYIIKGNIAEARSYLDMASETVERIGSQEHQVEVYNLYYKLYEKTGNLRLALDNYVQSTNLKDSLVNMKKLNNIQNQRLATERIMRQHELQLAEENLELERSEKATIIMAALFILLLLLAVAAIQWYRMRNRSEKQRLMQQMQQARENFFTNITHEFRTPLTVILGLGHQLEDQEIEDIGQVRSSAKMIVRQGNSLLGLINQLLDISKVRSAVGEAKWQHGNIVAFIDMSIENFQPYAQSKLQELTFTHSLTTLEIDFVPDYVEKIMSNLITNAIKFTPSYGKINVTLEQSGPNRVKLQVFDTGRGISAEALPHIFDAFYQGDTQAGDVGTGVGLSLVRMMVEGMNGTVTAESIEGQGSTFTIILPIKSKAKNVVAFDAPLYTGKGLIPATGIPEASGEPTPATQQETVSQDSASLEADVPEGDMHSILIVEDNQDIAFYIGMHLTKFRILHARNGEEGLKKAQEVMPDLIITDIMMPGGIDGLELCRRIRASEQLGHIPIIIITAKTTEADRIQGIDAGADAYLVKPFNSEELLVRVRHLLAKQQMLRDKYSQMGPYVDEQQSELSADDRKFMNRLLDVVYRLMAKGSISMESIADEMAVSRTQLNRKILSITGQNSSAYVMTLRLARSKRLLKADINMPIGEVAMRCGFDDVAYFSRIFKQAFMMTPSQYRKQEV